MDPTDNDVDMAAIGTDMYAWAQDIFPMNRSLTGPGVRETLAYVQSIIPDLEVHEVPSGTKAFDWEVPDEWSIRDAYVENEAGERVIDFKASNLHVVGYSVPVDTWMDLDDLQSILYSLPDQPDAIPYVTSYYRDGFGFCLSENDRKALKPGKYHVVVDSTKAPGSMSYGELILPGETDREVLISTYVCHPSMGNNETSGIVVATALAKWLSQRKNRKVTYRFLFAPEMIGSIVYLSRHMETMKAKTVAGWVLSCVGDDNAFSMLASRKGDTLTDRVTRHALRHYAGEFTEFDYLWPNRGSDERHYCAPGIDLPVVVFSRSKYNTYPEYHTSLDDLSLISPQGLAGAYRVLQACLQIVEADMTPVTQIIGEPRLGPRGLYPQMTSSLTNTDKAIRDMMNVLAYSDGTLDLVGLADRIEADALTCAKIIENLAAHGLIKV